jgi:AraC-like DNA-binding protein
MIIPRVESDIGGQATLHSIAHAGEFVITHKSYTHDFAQSWHEHEMASVDFVLAGGGIGQCPNREVCSSPGMIEFYPPQLRHNFRSGAAGIRSLHVVIPAAALGEFFKLKSVVVEELDHTRSVGLASCLFRELTDQDRSSNLVMESLAYELLGEIAGVTNRPTRRAGWMGAVRDVLHSVHDRSVSLTELAQTAGISRGHLARGFRSTMGMTAGEYHRRVRLVRGARALINSDLPISRVALNSGFVDQAHFSNAFRAHLGQTPGVYRRVLKG